MLKLEMLVVLSNEYALFRLCCNFFGQFVNWAAVEHSQVTVNFIVETDIGGSVACGIPTPIYGEFLIKM